MMKIAAAIDKNTKWSLVATIGMAIAAYAYMRIGADAMKREITEQNWKEAVANGDSEINVRQPGE